MDEPQFCHYPAHPPPIPLQLWQVPDRPCPYLPDRQETVRAFYSAKVDPLQYHAFMDASFRRSGNVIYQPICAGCRQCIPIRVPVAKFRPGKSQRRTRRKNADLSISIAPPKATQEKFELYARYQSLWHDSAEPDDPAAFLSFLYRSPVETIEFAYRDPAGRLLAIGICDECPQSLSSVYFYFDPVESRRSLGTFGALVEIDYALQKGIDYLYLGFWVKDSQKMSYKADFKPHELLQPDGGWLPIRD
jgi:arginine-tRNA-protein transferase